MSLVVVNSPKQFPFNLKDVTLVSARKYIGSSEYLDLKKITIHNLCSSYTYQSWGYYVSLLADARGHKVIPSVSSTQDFRSPTIIKSISEELEVVVQTALRQLKTDKFELKIYFGQSLSKEYQHLAEELYDLFQAPLLRATFSLEESHWELQNISPMALGAIPDEDLPLIEPLAQEYFSKPRPSKRQINRPYFDLAILVDPDETEPPSNKTALQRFKTIGAKMNINVDLITKEDYNRIPEYDALFIRATTSVDHFTYRFARYAQTEGLAVIDDPISILKCTNKVYLAELLQKANIKTPPTHLIHSGNFEELAKTLEFPCVLKQPDGSSSQGVSKVENTEEFIRDVKKLLKDSDLILAQKFMPTAFDWRIDILDGEPLVACRYHMAPKHWQIYHWQTATEHSWGKTEVVPFHEVPEEVVTTALKATRLIGSGLYGVDIKQIDGEVYVIEINDCASLDHRFEDKLLKDKLYSTVLNSFAKRVALLNTAKNVEI